MISYFWTELHPSEPLILFILTFVFVALVFKYNPGHDTTLMFLGPVVLVVGLDAFIYISRFGFDRFQVRGSFLPNSELTLVSFAVVGAIIGRLAGMASVSVLNSFSHASTASAANQELSTPAGQADPKETSVQPWRKQSAVVVFEPPSTPPPVLSAHLKLRRSQRVSPLRGQVLFALDARMEVPVEDHSLIAKYRLGSSLVYDSTQRQRYAMNANAHLDEAQQRASIFAPAAEQLRGFGRTLYKFGRASASIAMARLSLRITIQSLLAGVHVECKSMQELLEAEEAIVTAAQNLKSFLQTAATFDGRESIVDL